MRLNFQLFKAPKNNEKHVLKFGGHLGQKSYKVTKVIPNS